MERMNEVESLFWVAHYEATIDRKICIPDLIPQFEVKGGHWLDKVIYRLDFFSPAKKCAIEVDGLAYHNGMRSFVADRHRQRALEMEGIRVLRFAAVEVTNNAEYCYEYAAQWAERL